MPASELPHADQDCTEALRSAGLGPEWLSVTPPVALDLLVRERLHRTIERQRPSLAGERDHGAAPPRSPAVAPGFEAPALAMPVMERGVYALGLIGSGVQALEGFAKLMWRSVLG